MFEDIRLFEAVESEIRKKYELYRSGSIDEAIHLLEKLKFQVALIITFGGKEKYKLLAAALNGFLADRGTLIFTFCCFDSCASCHQRLRARGSLLYTRRSVYPRRPPYRQIHLSLRPQPEYPDRIQAIILRKPG